MPIDLGQAAADWFAAATDPKASDKYVRNTRGKGAYQKERSLAAEDSYKAAMEQVLSQGLRAKGVQAQDPDKYERNIAAKGVANRDAGIRAAGQAAWQAGFAPYAAEIDRIVAGFGAKHPKGDPRNVDERVKPIATGLHALKVSGKGAVPVYHTGGYVGQTGYAILEKGEYVIPKHEVSRILSKQYSPVYTPTYTPTYTPRQTGQASPTPSRYVPGIDRHPLLRR